MAFDTTICTAIPHKVPKSSDTYRMGPPFDSVQVPYSVEVPCKWLNSMVYGRYNMIEL